MGGIKAAADVATRPFEAPQVVLWTSGRLILTEMTQTLLRREKKAGMKEASEEGGVRFEPLTKKRGRGLVRQTHYAGAELFVRDVQGVSVPVQPPTRVFLQRPLPGFQVRHLPSLSRRRPPPPQSESETPPSTRAGEYLPGSCAWRRAPAVSGPRWSW